MGLADRIPVLQNISMINFKAARKLDPLACIAKTIGRTRKGIASMQVSQDTEPEPIGSTTKA